MELRDGGTDGIQESLFTAAKPDDPGAPVICRPRSRGGLPGTVGAMRTTLPVLIASLIASLIVCGCTTRSTRSASTDSAVDEAKGCKPAPVGRGTLRLGDALTASVSARPSRQNVALTFQLPLPVGAKVRFLSPAISVEVPGSWSAITIPIEPFVVSVYGEGSHLGHHESFRPDALLEGKGRNLHLTRGAAGDTTHLESDLHISHMLIRAVASDTIVLVFPPIEVNGNVIAAQRVPIRLVARARTTACMQ